MSRVIHLVAFCPFLLTEAQLLPLYQIQILMHYEEHIAPNRPRKVVWCARCGLVRPCPRNAPVVIPASGFPKPRGRWELTLPLWLSLCNPSSVDPASTTPLAIWGYWTVGICKFLLCKCNTVEDSIIHGIQLRSACVELALQYFNLCS